MTKAIKIGDWINTPEFNYEVEVTGLDRMDNRLIVRYFPDHGGQAYKTVSSKTATLYVDSL